MAKVASPISDPRVGQAPAQARGEFNLADVLGQASWAEADTALAQALVELHVLEHAVQSAAKPLRRSDAEDNADALETGVILLRQSLIQAARKRGLAPVGEIGAREAYDPRRHELMKQRGQAPALVKIFAPGWARGAEVLAKAQAVPVRSRGAAK